MTALLSANEWDGAARARVADTDAVIREQPPRKTPRRRPVEREGLVGDAEATAADPTLEADVHVVPRHAVGIAHDLQLGPRVHADESAWAHREARLLTDFADHGLVEGFADLQRAARQPPLPAVGAALQEHAAATVEDHGGNARPDTDDPSKVSLA